MARAPRLHLPCPWDPEACSRYEIVLPLISLDPGAQNKYSPALPSIRITCPHHPPTCNQPRPQKQPLRFRVHRLMKRPSSPRPKSVQGGGAMSARVFLTGNRAGTVSYYTQNREKRREAQEPLSVEPFSWGMEPVGLQNEYFYSVLSSPD
ncbi:hypothetical protein GN956_G11355 [Arapaima gigas]